MALNQRKGLRDLMAGRNKGSTSKEVPKSQIPPNLLPPPPPPITDLSLLPTHNLKKKRKDQELKEGEVVSQKGAKQQKTTKGPKDKKATFVDSRKELSGAEVCIQQCTWSPRLEVDGAAISWNSSIKKLQRGHSAHIAKALEQPLLLSKNMDALKRMRQPDLFLSLKMDLAMVSS